MRKKLTVTIDEKILDEYKLFCRKHSINMSRKIEKLMMYDMGYEHPEERYYHG